MQLGALLDAGSSFEDTPLTAADFQFSNALEAVDPRTGLPAIGGPAVIVAPIGSQGSGHFLLLAAIAAVAIWRYWPRIKQEVNVS